MLIMINVIVKAFLEFFSDEVVSGGATGNQTQQFVPIPGR
jgi:hypothetical protein